MIAQVHMSELDAVKRRLVNAFESGAVTDVAELLVAFPEHRDELLDFWVILQASDREHDVHAEDALAREPLTEAEEATIRDICLSSSLGPEWLQASPDEGERDLAEVGFEMQRIRSAPYRYGGTANENFQRAAVYAWLAHGWGASTDHTASRMAVQKLAYLLECGLGFGLYDKHAKHPLGPYDPTATYRDAEPIAVKNDYLVRVGKHELGLGPKAEKALSLAERYLRDAAVAQAFVRSLRELGLDRWALETLATVHAVVSELPVGDISAEAVRDALANDEKWSTKLSRPNFTRTKIEEALHRLALLRLVDPGHR